MGFRLGHSCVQAKTMASILERFCTIPPLSTHIGFSGLPGP